MKQTVYRIVQATHENEAFSGEGARLYPGRWNHRGVPMIYCAESVALAALEILVNAETMKLLERYVCIPATLDDKESLELRQTDLPKDWNAYPPPVSTRDYGSAWAAAKKTAILIVPSTVIPNAKNFLINPLHPYMKKIRIGKPGPFLFDPRLTSKR